MLSSETSQKSRSLTQIRQIVFSVCFGLVFWAMPCGTVVAIAVESLSCVQLFVTSRTVACQAPVSSTISWSLLRFTSSASSFFFCLHSFPAWRSFPMSWLFSSGRQGIGASATVLPMNIQDQFPLRLTGWISWQSRGFWRVFSNTKASILLCSVFFIVQLSQPYMTTGKTVTLTRKTSSLNPI